MFRAIDSVLAQTYPEWELIILDNSDEPYWDSSALAGFDERITYRHELCNGLADASTRALEMTKGDILIPLGDDDRFAPHALERAATAFKQWPTLRWMYGITEIRTPDETVVTHRGHIPFSLPELHNWYYLGGAVYFRRELYKHFGGYDPAYEGAADYALYLQFAEDSVPYWCPEVLYLYTDWAGTDSRMRAANQAQVTQTIVEGANA